MHLVKKILVVHGEAKVKRRLVLMLADAGYDLRAFTAGEAALETARVEWFDLALIDAHLSGAQEFEFVEALKKIQPTVPVVLVVPQLDLPLIVKGIRMGLSDVLPINNDLRPLVRRVHSLLRPSQPHGPDEDMLSLAELAEVEAALQAFGDAGASSSATGKSADPFNTPDFRQELMRGAKERAMLEEKTQRLEHEKAALEAELKTLLTQNADALHLQTEFAELRTQRETASAAQSVIDQKARALAEARSELARERTALEEERRRLNESAQSVSPFAQSADEIARERSELEVWRAKLAAEESRQRDEASRIQHLSTQLAQERRRWHEDLDLLREQETNLRDYESRLRNLQAQLEADRVLWFSARPQSRSPFNDDAAVKAAWEKLQRATDLLEAERAVFRDDRMAMRELEVEIKRREAKLEEMSAKLGEHEKRMKELPGVSHSRHGAPATAVKALSKAPFEMAKSLLGRKPGEE